MNGFFDKQSLGIPCPSCGHETKKSVGWIKLNDHFECVGCGQNVHLQRDKLLRDIKKVEKSLAEFGKGLGRR